MNHFINYMSQDFDQLGTVQNGTVYFAFLLVAIIIGTGLYLRHKEMENQSKNSI